MLSIDNYVDQAKASLNTNSDSELSRQINLSPGQVNSWRKRKSLPTDETMVRLASAGKVDVKLAILHLGWWRAVSRDEHQAAAVFLTMIEQHEKLAA
jgi:hypothetical protein